MRVIYTPDAGDFRLVMGYECKCVLALNDF